MTLRNTSLYIHGWRFQRLSNFIILIIKRNGNQENQGRSGLCCGRLSAYYSSMCIIQLPALSGYDERQLSGGDQELICVALCCLIAGSEGEWGNDDGGARSRHRQCSRL